MTQLEDFVNERLKNPKNRYDYPQTSQHEIWLSKPHVNNKRRNYSNRNIAIYQ